MRDEVKIQRTFVNKRNYRRSIAYRYQQSKQQSGAPILWLNGYRSVMTGNKANFISEIATENDWEYLRFDFSGNGESGGEFSNGTLTHWRDEALEMLRLMSNTPPILMGSSMGSWIALLVAKYLEKFHPERSPKALILMAPAVDYTENIIPVSLGKTLMENLYREGKIVIKSAYDENGYVIYKNYLEDAKQYCLLNRPIIIKAPITILHGDCDRDIPIKWGRKLLNMCHNESVTFKLIEGGDHRLSRQEDLELIMSTLEEYWNGN